MVEPGMILHKNKLYFMKDPLHLECPAEDRIRYVKIEFLTLVYENERTIGNTRVYLDDKLPIVVRTGTVKIPPAGGSKTQEYV